MSQAFRVVKNTGFLYSQILVNIVVSIYSTRLVLDALGVEDFGIYNLIIGSIATFTFLNSGMTEASQRFMSYALGEDNLNKQRLIFNVSFFLHFIVTVFVFIVLEIAGYFLFNGILNIPEERILVAKMVYQFMIISTMFTIIKIPFDAVLNSHENMLVVAITGILFSLLKLSIALYITKTEFDQLKLYGLLLALSYILITLIHYIYCNNKYKEVHFNIKMMINKPTIKEMGVFGSWSLLNHSAWIISIQGSSILLNSFFGVVANAAQGIANQISNQVRDFSFSLQKAINPSIVISEGRNDRANMLRRSLIGSKFSFFLISFMLIPLLIELPYLLEIWLKEIPEYAVVFTRLHLLRVPVGALTTSFYIAIGAIGNIRQTAVWESLISILVLPLSYLFFKNGTSPVTIYIVLLSVVTLRSVGRVYFFKKIGGLSVRFFILNNLVRCLSVFLISFFLASVPTLFQEMSFLRFLEVGIISSISFILSTYIIGFNSSEKFIVLELIKRVFYRFKRNDNQF